MITSYVIACYGGHRFTSGANSDDAKRYLDKQLKHIELYKHNLTNIVVVHPPFTNVASEYINYFNSLTHCGTTPIIKLISDKNQEMAFGSYEYAFKNIKADYYIITEDDQYPAIDNFDDILIDILEKENIDYVCLHISPTKCTNLGYIHAGNPIGLVRGPSIQTILEKDKTIFFEHPEIGSEYWHCQLKFSFQLQKHGFKIADVSKYGYRAETYYAQGKSTLEYNPSGTKDLFVPYQHFK